MNIYNHARRLPCASLFLSALALLIAAFPMAPSWLQYDRLAVASGELWRVLTGHWTHVSGDHLFWDVLMFAVLSMPCEQRHRRSYLACVASAVLLIPLGLWLIMPDLLLYRGLSGIDSALFTLLTVSLFRQGYRARHRLWQVALGMLCLAFMAKVGYEWMTGSAVFVHSQAVHMVPVPLAHGIGAVLGVVVGCTAAYDDSPGQSRAAGTPFHLTS
jgi:rhomboid family GlyGly-CTERM serine protease